MAEYGEWNRKGATLSDVTAKKEFGLSRDFIVKGIRAGKLEYREGTTWGNPYLRVLSAFVNEFWPPCDTEYWPPLQVDGRLVLDLFTYPMRAVGACGKPSAVFQGPVGALLASTGPAASTASYVAPPFFWRFSIVRRNR